MTEVTPVFISVLTENEILLSKSPFFFLKKNHISIYIYSKFDRLFLEKK